MIRRGLGLFAKSWCFLAPSGGQNGYHWSGFGAKPVGASSQKLQSLRLFGCGVTPWMLRSNSFGGFGQVWDDYRNSCVLWAEVFRPLWESYVDVLWVGFPDGILMGIFGLAITYVGLQVTPCKQLSEPFLQSVLQSIQVWARECCLPSGCSDARPKNAAAVDRRGSTPARAELPLNAFDLEARQKYWDVWESARYT